MTKLMFGSVLMALIFSAGPTEGYKPIFMLHGISGHATDFTDAIKWVQKAHPGTEALSIKMYEGTPGSWVPLNKQVMDIAEFIRDTASSNTTLYGDGYHLVCHSQGGLICRAVCEAMDDHNVDTLISLAGPQLGVYGKDFFDFEQIPMFENLTAEEIYKVAYLNVSQHLLSVANMWNDPNQQPEFMSHNVFLPKFNGYTADAPRLKSNFLKLKKAVFMVGSFNNTEYDGGIEPWQSGAFGKFDENGVYVPMERQPVFVSDTFGLRTLNESGRLFVGVVEGKHHSAWEHDEQTWEQYVLPHLV